MTNRKEETRMEIDKDTFYRLVANEARFTLQDTKAFWRAVEKVFENAVLSDTILSLPGFGKLYVKHVEAGRGWDQINKKWYDRKPHDRVVFKVSSHYKRILDEQKSDDQ